MSEDMNRVLGYVPAATINGAVNGAMNGQAIPQARTREWVEIKTITPAVAYNFLEDYAYDGQRKVSARHMEFLAMEMRAGRFEPSEFRLVHHDDSIYLTNGQHRLHAVIHSGVSIRGIIYHRIVDSMDEVAIDYGSADVGKRRTITEALAATQTVEQSGLTPTNYNRLAAAVKPILGGFTAGSYGGSGLYAKSLGLRLAAIHHWLDTAKLYFELLEGANQRLHQALTTMAPMGIALVTLEHQSDAAQDFWQMVARNDGLRRGDPRQALVSYLMTNRARTRTAHLHGRAVAAAWNAVWEDREMKQIRVTTANGPIYIAGTPHDGTQVWEYELGD